MPGACAINPFQVYLLKPAPQISITRKLFAQAKPSRALVEGVWLACPRRTQVQGPCSFAAGPSLEGMACWGQHLFLKAQTFMDVRGFDNSRQVRSIEMCKVCISWTCDGNDVVGKLVEAMPKKRACVKIGTLKNWRPS